MSFYKNYQYLVLQKFVQEYRRLLSEGLKPKGICAKMCKKYDICRSTFYYWLADVERTEAKNEKEKNNRKK